MKVILLQNSVLKGVRYLAGQEADVPADIANAMKKANLAHFDEPNTEEVKQEKPKTRKVKK